MAYEKLQIELYANQGGINEKASEYITGDNYFLSLRNYGFQRPGAIQSRPGSADTATIAISTFQNIPRIHANFEFAVYGAGGSFQVFDSGNRLVGLTNTPLVLNSSFTSNVTTSYPIDSTLAKNRLYLANGQAFGHLGITSYTFFSLQGGTLPSSTGRLSLAIQGGPGQTFIIPSGTYVATYSYVRYIEGTSLYEVGERYHGPSFKFFNLGSTLVGKQPIFTAGRFRLADERFGSSHFAVWIAPPGATFEFINIFPNGIDLFLAVDDQSYIDRLPEPDLVPYFTLQPRFLEQYKNMLFMSGFSASPSTVWHSELADAENVQPENFFEVRTDNGDNITCIKTFQNTLIVFKSKSVHELNGDSPDTLTLKDITLDYGCVNNDAAVVFDNRLWFVDKRGICEYAGSNVFIVSEAVETTFKTLDLSLAKAFHVKKRTEVWFCFGATKLVFDYTAKAWTIYDGEEIKSGQGSDLIEYGASTFDLTFWRVGSTTGDGNHQLVRFNDVLNTDRGSPITLIAKTTFFKRMGDATQELFRRFYLDYGTPSLATGVTINFRTDYGASIHTTKSISLLTFQSKVEIGISARSLSAEWIIQSSTRITINGYALHARYLRNV